MQSLQNVRIFQFILAGTMKLEPQSLLFLNDSGYQKERSSGHPKHCGLS
jgi:hypothetical protein